jgi:hypothetical protein
MAKTYDINQELLEGKIEISNPVFGDLVRDGLIIKFDKSKPRNRLKADADRNTHLNDIVYPTSRKNYNKYTVKRLIANELGSKYAQEIEQEYDQRFQFIIHEAIGASFEEVFYSGNPTSYNNINTKSLPIIFQVEQWNFPIKNIQLSEGTLFYIYGPCTLEWVLNKENKFELKKTLITSDFLRDCLECKSEKYIQFQKTLKEMAENASAINNIQNLINTLKNIEDEEHKTELIEQVQQHIAGLKTKLKLELPAAIIVNNDLSPLFHERKYLLDHISKLCESQMNYCISLYPDDIGIKPKYFLGKELKKSFHKIFNPNSFRSDFASFFGYPRPTNPFHWFEYIFMGWLLNPIKNAIKFVLEFLPAVIEKTAKWRIEESRRKFPGRVSIAIGMLKVVRYTAKAIRLFTQRFTSPMRSAKEAFYWGRNIHPALGYAAALLSLTISAAGVATIAFFAAPLLGLGISAYAVAGIATGVWADLSALRAGIRKLTFAATEKIKEKNAQPKVVANRVVLPPAQEEKQIAGDTARVLKSFAAHNGDIPLVSPPEIETNRPKSTSPEAKPVTENTATLPSVQYDSATTQYRV